MKNTNDYLIRLVNRQAKILNILKQKTTIMEYKGHFFINNVQCQKEEYDQIQEWLENE